MRVLVPVLLVLAIGLIFLLYVWTDRRRSVRRERLQAAEERADAAISWINFLKKEVELQITAQRPDLNFLHDLVREALEKTEKRKELTR